MAIGYGAAWTMGMAAVVASVTSGPMNQSSSFCWLAIALSKA